MANVLFKRGLQANLPANGSVEDGVFYLTTDTNRLYVGVGTNSKLLNQTVQIVSNISDLTALTTQWGANANDHINDFYYVSGANILAVYTGSGADAGWVQINPDHNTTVDSVDLSAVVANNTATVTSTVTDSDSHPQSGSMEISADGSVHLTQTSNGFEISGDKYSLDKTVANDNRAATLTLTSTSGVAADNSSIQFRNADGNVTFTSESAGVLVAVKDTTLVNGSNGASVSVNNGTVSIGVTDTDSNTASGSVSNIGVALTNASGTADAYLPINAFSAGTSTGAIYSKAAIDDMMSGLDGMTYKGTIGASGATVSTLPTSGVKNGDTYVVVTRGWTSSNFTGATFEANTAAEMAGGTRVGDMVIAKGTETNGVISSGLTWTYIPAGNDSLDAVTYSAVVDDTTHSLRLDNANNATIAKIALVAGTDVSLSSAVSTNGNANDTLTTTINHASYAAVTPAAASTLSTGSASFTAIKGITVSNGHVTAIETDTFTPVTYDLSGASLTQTSSVNGTSNVGTSTVEAEIGLTDSNSGSHTSAELNFTSNSIKITGSGSTVTMNFEWGNF